MLKLDGSEAYLDGLDKILGVPELKALSGKIGLFNVNISGPVDALNGIVNFNAPRIVYDGRALTDIKAQMKLSQSDTANVDGKFTFEDASGYLSGNVASILTTPIMNLTAKIADLDIKRIESMIPDAPQYKLDGKITASVTVKGAASSPSVEGEINSPEFSGWGQKITKPAVNFSFSEKTLTLRRTEGTINGMPISLTGKISDIPSPNPKLDINATMTMTTSALKAYVPDIESYDLKGTINAGLKIGGDMDNPSVSLIAESPILQAMDIITANDLELTTAMDVDLSDIGKNERITVNVSAKSITAGGVTLTGANANISKNGDAIILGGLSARSGEGTVTGAGTASFSGKSPLDFSFRFTDLDLAELTSSSSSDVSGKLSGTLKIAGHSKDITGNGAITSPLLTAFGLKFSDVNLPLAYSGNSLISNGGTAKLYGGNVKNALTFSTDTMNFSDDIEASGVDMNSLIQDVSGGLEGKISGTGKLTLSVTGTSKDYTGNGNFSMGQGAVTGFKISGDIKFADVNAPLTLQNGKLAVKSGAIANAMKDDTLYRRAELVNDGIIDFSGKNISMDIAVKGGVSGDKDLTLKLHGKTDALEISMGGIFEK